MTSQIIFFILLSVSTLVCAFPRTASRNFHRHPRKDFESSGSGPDEPIRGSVRVVKMSPHFLRRAAGAFGNHAPSRSTQGRSAFPAFLARGLQGPSVLTHDKPAALLPNMGASNTGDAKKQGLEMWQKVTRKIDGGREAVALRINHKDMSKQSCAAVPFTQRITEGGCETVTVHNNMCFGQCTSMFVPSNGESRGQRDAHCTRCGPSKSRYVVVPLRCGTEVRERRVMVVEECKCETGSEDVKSQNTETLHL
ncbi:DAN domain family member 5 [Triplophysa dalaica]|uniref:DAN domain family member 5 n=1 Tax=Triplophysa dalaica TaxID=1582913 RepID=UPI0024E006B3|nr:DAN domain family member 5 [Triplophysa dalaica]